MPKRKTPLVTKKIVKTAENIHSKILKSKSPTLSSPVRSLSNVKYQARVGYFEMLGRSKQRTLTVGTVKTFAQSLKMMALCESFYCTYREGPLFASAEHLEIAYSCLIFDVAYLYELAQKFSAFYTNCPVLDAGPNKRPTRLLLCDLTARTIKHGLSELLGIEVVEQM